MIEIQKREKMTMTIFPLNHWTKECTRCTSDSEGVEGGLNLLYNIDIACLDIS